MSYSGYLFYKSQDNLGEPFGKYNLLNPKTKDVETGCRACKHARYGDDDSEQMQKKEVRMGVPFVMITIGLAQILLFFTDTGIQSLSFDPNQRHQVWRYVTYMLVHADIYHLASNVLLQLVAGIIIEKDQRWWRALMVYLAGVVAGSMASVDGLVMVGSSSGAYALFFSQIPQVLLNHQNLKYLKSRIGYLLVCIIFGSLYEAYMVCVADSAMKGAYRIAFHSHVAGLISGAVTGFVLFKENKRVVRYSFAFVLFYLTIIGVVYNIYRATPDDVV